MKVLLVEDDDIFIEMVSYCLKNRFEDKVDITSVKSETAALRLIHDEWDLVVLDWYIDAFNNSAEKLLTSFTWTRNMCVLSGAPKEAIQTIKKLGKEKDIKIYTKPEGLEALYILINRILKG